MLTCIQLPCGHSESDCIYAQVVPMKLATLACRRLAASRLGGIYIPTMGH